MSPCTFALTPHGRLIAVPVPDAPALPGALAERLLADSNLPPGRLLLGLGIEQVGVPLPPVIAWWRDLAVRYLTALCTLPEAAEQSPGRVPLPEAAELQALAWSLPPMDGAEYLTVEVLAQHWQELDATLHAALQDSELPLAAFLKERNPAMRAFGERVAGNAPIQGSAADLIKLAMLRVHEALAREGLAARMLLQVHDELVFEFPTEEEGALRALVKREMEQAAALDVPLLVEMGVGPNWVDAKS